MIGVFDPTYNDPNEAGVVTSGKDTIYTDVLSFTERIYTFIEDDESYEEYAPQLRKLFPTLLQGQALQWYNTEITPYDRQKLRNKGIESMLSKLRKRFQMDQQEASIKFTNGKPSLYDIGKDPTLITLFFQKKMRYAKVLGLLDESNKNWHAVCFQLWNTLELDVHQNLDRPSKKEKLSSFMRRVEESKPDMRAAAIKRYPALRDTIYGRSSFKSYDDDKR
jgi:hypothetical protein